MDNGPIWIQTVFLAIFDTILLHKTMSSKKWGEHRDCTRNDGCLCGRSWIIRKQTQRLESLTMMVRLAFHLLAPSIGSSLATFLSDSFTKSPLHSQVTWNSIFAAGLKSELRTLSSRRKKRENVWTFPKFQHFLEETLFKRASLIGHCGEPLVLGWRECVPPGSRCLGPAARARAARTPCRARLEMWEERSSDRT